MPWFEHVSLWRLHRGLTQAELARRAGISRPNLVALELGRRDCTTFTALRLAEALGISVGTLLDRRPSPPFELNRHQLDRLARGVLKPGQPLPRGLDTLRNQLIAFLQPMLRASGHLASRGQAGSRGRIRCRKLRLEGVLGRQRLHRIVERVSKLAGALHAAT